MKNVPLIIRTIGSIAVLAVLVSAGQAQNREKFGISAKAGGVNAVTGHVTVTRTGPVGKSVGIRTVIVWSSITSLRVCP